MTKLGDLMKNKRYIILVLIYVFSITSVLYFSKLYKNSVTNFSDVSESFVFNDVSVSNLNELRDMVLNYSKETNSFLIYVTSRQNNSLKSFEDRIEKLSIDSSFKAKILYINVDSFKSFDFINKFISEFGEDGFSRVKRNDLPILMLFSNGRIVEINSVSNLDDDSLKSIMEGVK